MGALRKCKDRVTHLKMVMNRVNHLLAIAMLLAVGGAAPVREIPTADTILPEEFIEGVIGDAEASNDAMGSADGPPVIDPSTIPWSRSVMNADIHDLKKEVHAADLHYGADTDSAFKMAVADAIRDAADTAAQEQTYQAHEAQHQMQTAAAAAAEHAYWVEQNKAIALKVMEEMAHEFPNCTSPNYAKQWHEHELEVAQKQKEEAEADAARKAKWQENYAKAKSFCDNLLKGLVDKHGSVDALRSHLENETERQEGGDSADSSDDDEDDEDEDDEDEEDEGGDDTA